MRQSLALLFVGLALPPAWSATLPRNPAPILPIPWQYLGCYSDNPSNRVLSKATYKDEAYMTGESCVRFCSDNGYSFAGTEYSSECWCGFQIQGSESHPDDCDMVCAGDGSQTCGGPSRLSVYTNGASEPQTNPGVNAYSLLGCYSDSVHTRTLSHKVAVEGYMSVSKCTTECKTRGYPLSGVEYGDECFCGNSVQNNAIALTGNPSNTGCDMVCRGNSSEYCGGRDRLNIYRRDEDQPGTTPTSTSTPVPTPTIEPPVNLLSNGGFEESYGWSTGRNPVIYNISPLSARNSWLTPYAYTGTHASAIGEFTSPGTGVRSLCFSQLPAIPESGTYKFVAYVGRIASPPPGQTSTTDTIRFDLFINHARMIRSVDVCNPTLGQCTLNAQNGELVYNLVEATFELRASSTGNSVVDICATYTDSRNELQDTFLVDAVSLVKIS